MAKSKVIKCKCPACGSRLLLDEDGEVIGTKAARPSDPEPEPVDPEPEPEPVDPEPEPEPEDRNPWELSGDW